MVHFGSSQPSSLEAAVVPGGMLPFRGVVAGLCGALLIWLGTPYVNFVLRVGFIADGQLPVGVMVLVCLLVFGINPALRAWRPGAALRPRELNVAVAIFLFAATPASGGLLRMLVNSLAMVPYRAAHDRRLAEMYRLLHLPPSLFPDRLGYGIDTPVSSYFLDRLPPGLTIPWRSWLPPLLAWGAFMFFAYLMMMGLGVLVYTQWKENERLPFPLLSLLRPVLRAPEPGRRLPPLLRRRSFWAAAAGVFLLHFMGGVHRYDPGAMPAIPLEFDVHSVFAVDPFVYLPRYVSRNRIYFTFLALAYFMPNRVSVSIWFWQVAYALYAMYKRAYFPPYYSGAISHQRSGAMMALALAIFWLGRRRWWSVARGLFQRAQDEAARRDRRAGWTVAAGCAGMTAWLAWAGVPWAWAAGLTAMAVMLAVVTARMVAETGLIQVWLYQSQLIDFARLMPGALYTPVTLYFVGVVAVIFGNGGRVSAPSIMAHAVGLDERLPPRGQAKLLQLAIPVLMAGMLVCGAAYLGASYHYATSLDGKWRPLTPWGAAQLEHSQRLVRYWQQGALGQYTYNKFLHFGIGAGLAGICEWLCLTSPSWPIHPVGLLIVGQWHANLIWFSVFLGWLVKVLLVRYGGAALYRRAIPAVLGMIFGELFAGVFWMLVGFLALAFHHEFVVVPVIPY